VPFWGVRSACNLALRRRHGSLQFLEKKRWKWSNATRSPCDPGKARSIPHRQDVLTNGKGKLEIREDRIGTSNCWVFVLLDNPDGSTTLGMRQGRLGGVPF
jgi:hypothetical protein